MPQRQRRKGEKKSVRNSSGDTKVSEGGRDGAPDAGTEIPLQPTEKTMVEHVVHQ